MIRITRVRRGKLQDLANSRSAETIRVRSRVCLAWTPREKWIESDDDRRLFKMLLEQSERIAREARGA